MSYSLSLFFPVQPVVPISGTSIIPDSLSFSLQFSPPFLEMQDTNNHHHDRTILTRLKSVIVAIHAVIQPGPAQVLGLFLFFFSSMGLLL